jgi:threonylcarbamoyladenosine tRNA methylthiotransferase MtaB
MRYHSYVPTYHVENFGCRATQADGAALDRQFQHRGLKNAPSAQADLVILNTCTVTAAADQDARAAIRRIQRQNPNAKIFVTGCYAQRAPQEIAALSGVTAVIGNSHKHQLADLALLPNFTNGNLSAAKDGSVPDASGAFVPLTALTENAGSREPESGSQSSGSRLFVTDIFAHTELLAAPVFEFANFESANLDSNAAHADQRTRPNLKVQDGCDNRCSFCVIPYVRGQSRSLPLDQVLREVDTLAAAGYREVVISGINLGRWGRDLDVGRRTSDLGKDGSRFEVRSPGSEVRGQKSAGSRELVFEDLIEAILNHTSLEKLRISSVEPMDWSDALIHMVAESSRIAKHAHVPLQSGSDAVLRRMHRKYRPWHYREKIEKIRAAMPTAAIGADVMVGFPGETEAEFHATRRLIEDLPFTYLHVFSYSARPGTPAAALPNQVPAQVSRERNRILRELGEEKKRRFMHSFLGQTITAITLGSHEEGSSGAGILAASSLRQPAAFTEALTDNYLKLHLQGIHHPNRWIKAEVEAVAHHALMGQAI